MRIGLIGLLVAVTASACTASGGAPDTPDLAARGTILTTAKPTRQDLANRVSLTGKVTMNPVFGVVAPVTGQVRYREATARPDKPTRVATVTAGGKQHPVDIPAGAVLTGRLVDDRSTVTAGMPIAAAKHSGYGVVADIDGEQAYRIAGSLASVRAQIKNGPGPFACTVLGTIAALPEGTLPAEPPPAPAPTTDPRAFPFPKGPGGPGDPGGPGASGPTGLRLVCTPPAGVKMINGAAVVLEVVTEKATNVLVLPVEAVAGTQGRGQVSVVRPDGTRETKDVVLGLTDGRVVEIRSGLTGDETIAVPGPSLVAPK